MCLWICQLMVLCVCICVCLCVSSCVYVLVCLLNPCNVLPHCARPTCISLKLDMHAYIKIRSLVFTLMQTHASMPISKYHHFIYPYADTCKHAYIEIPSFYIPLCRHMQAYLYRNAIILYTLMQTRYVQACSTIRHESVLQLNLSLYIFALLHTHTHSLPLSLQMYASLCSRPSWIAHKLSA
jgi:hypothetical protein